MSRVPATCAVDRCDIPVQRGMLMCKGHWLSLPKPLRDAVWRTWRKVFNAEYRRGVDPETQLRQIREYRDAVRAAREYLEGVPPTSAPAAANAAVSRAKRT